MIVQLSRRNEVDVVTFQSDINSAIGGYAPGVHGRTRFLIPRVLSNKRLPERRYLFTKRVKDGVKYRWYFKTFTSTDSSLLAIIPLLNSIAINTYDVIIFEHIESLRLLRKVKSLFPGALVVLDAHNVDQVLLKNTSDNKRLNAVIKIESNLYKNIDLLVTVSDVDAALFQNLNKKTIKCRTVPNGVDLTRFTYQTPILGVKEKKIIFCGSLDYQPNRAGLIWFFINVWDSILKKNPSVSLLVVGSGDPGDGLTDAMKSHRNIHYVGEVPDVIPFYRQAQVAIVPIREGSGTRLKILEAMALGTVIMSTSIGAEGINCEHGQELFICDTPEEFVTGLDLLENQQNIIAITQKARELVVNQYSWTAIGEGFNKELNQLKAGSFINDQLPKKY